MRTFPILLTDAGRSTSRRPHQQLDCTVRALASARGLSYDDAYVRLADAGRKCSCRFPMDRYLNDAPWAVRHTFPALKGEPRMTPVRFCRNFQEGVWICKIAKHVFAVIEGVVLDDCDLRADACIYRAWKVSSYL